MEKYFALIISLCWIVFIVYWIYGAIKAKRTLRRGYWGIGILWRLLIVVFVIVVAKVDAPILMVVLDRINIWWGIVGCVLAIIGTVIAISARYYLGRNWGMPMSIKENPELVTSGPYRWIRNPIYTGVILTTLGSAMTDGVWWFIVFLGTILYFTISLFQEEKDMQKEFPDTYPAYKARTWRLIPYIF